MTNRRHRSAQPDRDHRQLELAYEWEDILSALHDAAANRGVRQASVRDLTEILFRAAESQTGVCDLEQEVIAVKLRCSVPTVRKLIREAQELEWIQVREARRGWARTYWVNVARILSDAGPEWQKRNAQRRKPAKQTSFASTEKTFASGEKNFASEATSATDHTSSIPIRNNNNKTYSYGACASDEFWPEDGKVTAKMLRDPRTVERLYRATVRRFGVPDTLPARRGVHGAAIYTIRRGIRENPGGYWARLVMNHWWEIPLGEEGCMPGWVDRDAQKQIDKLESQQNAEERMRGEERKQIDAARPSPQAPGSYEDPDAEILRRKEEQIAMGLQEIKKRSEAESLKPDFPTIAGINKPAGAAGPDGLIVPQAGGRDVDLASVGSGDSPVNPTTEQRATT